MAAKKADERKEVYTYREKPSIRIKAAKKAITKKKSTLAIEISNLIYELSQL